MKRAVAGVILLVAATAAVLSTPAPAPVPVAVDGDQLRPVALVAGRAVRCHHRHRVRHRHGHTHRVRHRAFRDAEERLWGGERHRHVVRHRRDGHRVRCRYPEHSADAINAEVTIAARKRATTTTTKAPTTTTTTSTTTTTAPPGPGAAATAVDAWTATVTWTSPAGTSRVRLSRDGRLLDELAAGTASTWTDPLLWPATSFTYEVRFLDAAGATLTTRTPAVTTPAATGPVPRLYADTSFWNTPVPAGAALAPNSAAMVEKAVVAYRSNANLAFSDKWGIPRAYASAPTKEHDVGCTLYDCHLAVRSRIPAGARWSLGSDQHLAVFDPATGRELDMYRTSHDLASDTWSAGARYTTLSSGWGAMCGLGERCNGAVASGFALFGGVIRPEEVAQGRIDHALAFTTPFTRSGVIACPATHTDGKYADPDAVPEGARMRLDPSFDVDAQAWPRWKKVVARALQTYGAYLVDTSGSLALRAESNLNRGYDAWGQAGVTSPWLSDLPWERMQVLAWEPC